MAAPAIVRVCRAHGSVVVASPASSPSLISESGGAVALEATGNALGIARIIEPYVGRVVLANPKAVKGDHPCGREDRLCLRLRVAVRMGGEAVLRSVAWLKD